VHGVIDVRLSGADGEPSFTEGGFGKTRYGGGENGDLLGRLQIALAALEWTPRLGWEWSAVIDAGYQPDQEHPADLYQAYLVYKPVPHSSTRFAARLGLFYPALSMEHDARVWGITDTITPSAINSWVGEELKVVGGEGTITHDFGGQTLALTVGAFGFDDTAGTLLAFRGWAMHDIKSQANGSFELPPLSFFASHFQDSETYSTLSIAARVGYYGKIEWRPSDRASIQGFYYNNAGDPAAVTDDLQWNWATHFGAIGGSYQIDEKTRILAQALNGRTVIGHPAFRLTDVTFRAAYVMVQRDIGPGTLSARADLFETVDNHPFRAPPNGERGWALTGAWRFPITDYLDVRLEALHVDSTRPARVLALEPSHQAQDELQSSLRLTF
jgi:hypothetical protein